MIILDKELILEMHSELIREFGGTDGVLNEGLLESALAAPFQSFGKKEAYPTVEEKAVRLGYGLVMNHAFADGNKRIGAHAMLALLRLNNIRLHYTQKELSDIFLSAAAGKTSYEQLLSWVQEHA